MARTKFGKTPLTQAVARFTGDFNKNLAAEMGNVYGGRTARDRQESAMIDLMAAEGRDRTDATALASMTLPGFPPPPTTAPPFKGLPSGVPTVPPPGMPPPGMPPLGGKPPPGMLPPIDPMDPANAPILRAGGPSWEDMKSAFGKVAGLFGRPGGTGGSRAETFPTTIPPALATSDAEAQAIISDGEFGDIGIEGDIGGPERSPEAPPPSHYLLGDTPVSRLVPPLEFGGRWGLQGGRTDESQAMPDSSDRSTLGSRLDSYSSSIVSLWPSATRAEKRRMISDLYTGQTGESRPLRVQEFAGRGEMTGYERSRANPFLAMELQDVRDLGNVIRNLINTSDTDTAGEKSQYLQLVRMGEQTYEAHTGTQLYGEDATDTSIQRMGDPLEDTDMPGAETVDLEQVKEELAKTDEYVGEGQPLLDWLSQTDEDKARIWEYHKADNPGQFRFMSPDVTSIYDRWEWHLRAQYNLELANKYSSWSNLEGIEDDVNRHYQAYLKAAFDPNDQSAGLWTRATWDKKFRQLEESTGSFNPVDDLGKSLTEFADKGPAPSSRAQIFGAARFDWLAKDEETVRNWIVLKTLKGHRDQRLGGAAAQAVKDDVDRWLIRNQLQKGMKDFTVNPYTGTGGQQAQRYLQDQATPETERQVAKSLLQEWAKRDFQWFGKGGLMGEKPSSSAVSLGSQSRSY